MESWGYPSVNKLTGKKEQKKISCCLGTFCTENQEDWAQFLPWAEYIQNSLHRSIIQLTPFQCILSYQSPLFLWTTNLIDSHAVNNWLRQSEQVSETAL